MSEGISQDEDNSCDSMVIQHSLHTVKAIASFY